MRLHDDDTLPEPDVLLKVVERNEHSQRQSLQNCEARLARHVLRVLPRDVHFSIPLVQNYVLHRARSVMHKAVLGAELSGQTHAHTLVQRTKAKQLARRVHVHHLQRPPVLRLAQWLRWARLYGLRVEQELLRSACILQRTVLQQTLHSLPRYAHVIPLPLLAHPSLTLRTQLAPLSPLPHFVPGRILRLGVEYLPSTKHLLKIFGHATLSRTPHVLEKPRHVLVLEAMRLAEHHCMRHSAPENPTTGIALVVPRRLRIHD